MAAHGTHVASIIFGSPIVRSTVSPKVPGPSDPDFFREARPDFAAFIVSHLQGC